MSVPKQIITSESRGWTSRLVSILASLQAKSNQYEDQRVVPLFQPNSCREYRENAPGHGHTLIPDRIIMPGLKRTTSSFSGTYSTLARAHAAGKRRRSNRPQVVEGMNM
ncbi:hypothetical protein J3458_000956 [Metarhizium acridum]|uniref:uncharacterized protein n=1 Tax=Metarhizium acridum TaxID=92637 RepID=UPI001C6C0099|nr:hypothetical protein J3458_000956 [Metarhizium acridum]